MFETSRDILNITLSVSVLAVAIALTWLLSEFIRIFRDVRKTIKEVKDDQVVVDTPQGVMELAIDNIQKAVQEI